MPSGRLISGPRYVTSSCCEAPNALVNDSDTAVSIHGFHGKHVNVNQQRTFVVKITRSHNMLAS